VAPIIAILFLHILLYRFSAVSCKKFKSVFLIASIVTFFIVSLAKSRGRHCYDFEYQFLHLQKLTPLKQTLIKKIRNVSPCKWWVYAAHGKINAKKMKKSKEKDFH